MKRFGWLVLAAALLWTDVAAAQQPVDFPSAGDNGAAAPTMLTGYLFRPSGSGPFPALVFAHGCYGMFARRAARAFLSRDLSWATTMTQQGYVVLMVDSFGPRQHGEMCSQSGFERPLYLKRPRDAYGALAYLQAQPFVQPDRVGIMGWSQGGGVVLLSIRAASLGRPPGLPADRDFRAAVAFYPASCSDKAHSQPWTSTIPLLVLMGEGDVWTAAGPCRAFLEGAKARGSPVDSVFYPGTYHDFDFPGEAVHAVPQYVTRDGVVPIAGTDATARADALQRVPAFFAAYLKGR
ncbi:MAG TPA: dienelactone hydrolase family protein [Stellaceae bacterium]|nr:dienelactone hydrolase family protein [Stellaceae bacterium]